MFSPYAIRENSGGSRISIGERGPARRRGPAKRVLFGENYAKTREFSAEVGRESGTPPRSTNGKSSFFFLISNFSDRWVT